MFARLLRRRRRMLSERLGRTSFIRLGYELILGREPDPRGFADFQKRFRSEGMTRAEFRKALLYSAEFQRVRRHPEAFAGVTYGLIALHESRTLMVRGLPTAEVILDLGGACEGQPEGALVVMGYPYAFGSLTIVEPPATERHDLYKGACRDEVQTCLTQRGEVRYLFRSMADLAPVPSGSVDLVFSGESIEHVTKEEAGRVFAEVRRVLKPGGSFCFDTPNRRVTRIQVGDRQFINADHKHEYTHSELMGMLERHGFTVVEAKGLNWVPESVRCGRFIEEELIANVGMFDDIEDCYLLYYRCRRHG
jgi:predicted SAM-dependent methyltransferase